jgi:hypothetical protein
MPDVQLGPDYSTPFGRNVWLRSTDSLQFEHYTFAKAGIPAVTIDGFAGQKVLQPGTAIAKITSGGDAGKVGVFSAGATDGRQTAANLVGICNTFLPWQLIHRDVEIAVAYAGTGVQAWCFEYDAGNLRIALSNTTADALRSTKGLDLLFK